MLVFGILSILPSAVAEMGETSVEYYEILGQRPEPEGISERLDRNPFEQMEAFVQQGKVDAAVGLAVSQLRSLLDQATFRRHSLLGPVQRIKKAKLTDQVLEHFDPQGSPSCRKVEAYAILLDAFGREEDAAALWQELQTMRPGDSSYALEVAYRSSGETAVAVIEELLTRKAYPQIDEDIGIWLVQKTQYSNQLRFNQWMRLLEISTQFMDSFEPSTAVNINLSWAPYLGLRFAQSTRIEGQQYPGLIERQTQRRSSNAPDGLAERIQERSTRYETFCRAMLRHPQTARQGFELLFLQRLGQGDDPFSDPQLKTAAVTAALLDAQYKPPVGHLNQPRQRWAFIGRGGKVYSNNNIEGLHPLVFLARLAGRGEAVDLGEIARVIARHDPVLATDLQGVAALLAADDVQFSAVFQQWIASEASDLRMSFLPEIFRRGVISEPALQALLEYGQAQLAATHVHQQPDIMLFARIASILADQGRIDLLNQWFDHLFAFYLGPKDGWRATVAAYTPQDRYATSPGNYQLSRAWQLAQQLSEERDLVLPLVRYTRDSGIGMQTHSIHQLRQDLASGFDEVAEALEWCERQQLLNEFEQFDPLIVLDAQRVQQGLPLDSLPDNRNVVVYETALRNLSFRDDADGEKNKQFLAQLKERGFSGQILAAFIEGRSTGRATAIAALESHASAFDALPESEQQGIAFLFKYWIRDGQTVDGDPAIVAQLQQIWLEEMRAEAEAYLSLDIPLTDQTYRSEAQLLSKWLASLIWEEPKLAAQLYLRWLERDATFVPTALHLTTSQRRSYNENLLRAVFSQTSRSGRALESLNQYFAFIAVHHPDEAGPIATQDLRKLRTVLEYRLKEATGSTAPKLDQILEVLPGIIPEDEAPEYFVAALGLFDYMLYEFRYGGNDADSIRATLSSEDMDSSRHMRWLRVALLARMADDEAGRAVAAAKFAQILSDAVVPSAIRMGLWRSALQKSPTQWLHQPVMAGPSCDLLDGYLKKSFPVLDQEFSETLEQLRPALALNAWQVPLRELLPALAASLPTLVDKQDENTAKDVAVSIILMALELREIETARSVIQKHSHIIGSDSRILHAMLTAGQIDEAVRLTPPDGAFDASPEMQYTRQLHDELPAYLAKITKPAVRYTLAVNLGLLPDAPNLGESVAPDRTTRSDKLLQEFPAHKTDPRAVEHLYHLNQYVTDRAALVRYASELLAGRSLVGLIADCSRGSHVERQRAKAALELYGLTIHAQPAGEREENLLVRMGLTPGEDFDDTVWQFLRQRQRQLSSAFLDGLETYGRAEFLGFVPESRAMLELLLQSGRELPYDEASHAYFIYFISHIGAGGSAQIGSDLSNDCLPYLQRLRSQWATPEAFLKKMIYWLGRQASETPRRHAALGLLLSDHAQLDAVWSTSPEELTYALLGHVGSKRERDLEAVLSELDLSSHPRAAWIQYILSKDILEKKDADLVELIRLYARIAEDIKSLSTVYEHYRKLQHQWKRQILNPDETSTSLDYAWTRMQEVVDQLDTEAERHWASISLHYFMRYERGLEKITEADGAWVEQKMRSESIIDRMCLLGLLYRSCSDRPLPAQIPSALKQILMSILEDVSLPFQMRYQLCEDATGGPFYKIVDQDVYRAQSQLLIELVKRDYELYILLWTRPNLDDFYRKDLGEALVPDVREMLRVLNQAILVKTIGLSNSQAAGLIRLLSLLSLKFGVTEQVPDLAAVIEEPRWMNVDYFMWLIRRGMYDFAETLLEQHDMLKDSHYRYGYDAALNANLPIFLERYESPAARYRMEVIFASVEDSKYFPLPSELPDRRARCRHLLARFEAYSDDPDAVKMLDLITADEALEQEAASWIIQLCPTLSMKQIIKENKARNLNRVQVSLYGKHLANRVRDGEIEFVVAELEVLLAAELSRRDSWYIPGLLEQLVRRLPRCFIDDASVSDPARIGSWMGLIETLIELYQNPRMSNNKNSERILYQMYQMARQAALPSSSERDAFLQSAAYQALDGYFSSSAMRYLSYLIAVLDSHIPELERKRLITALRLLLENEAFLDRFWNIRSSQLTRELELDVGTVRAALLKVLPERIAAGSKYAPWYAYLLADYCYAPQDETEEAIKWYARAREAALASEVEKFRMTAGDATLRLVELWQAQTGGTAQILDLLETTPADVFTEEAGNKVQVLREML